MTHSFSWCDRYTYLPQFWNFVNQNSISLAKKHSNFFLVNSIYFPCTPLLCLTVLVIPSKTLMEIKKRNGDIWASSETLSPDSLIMELRTEWKGCLVLWINADHSTLFEYVSFVFHIGVIWVATRLYWQLRANRKVFCPKGLWGGESLLETAHKFLSSWLRGVKMRDSALRSKTKMVSKSWNVGEKRIRTHLLGLSTAQIHVYLPPRLWHKGAGGCWVGKEKSCLQWQSRFFKSGSEKGPFSWSLLVRWQISFTF